MDPATHFPFPFFRRPCVSLQWVQTGFPSSKPMNDEINRGILYRPKGQPCTKARDDAAPIATNADAERFLRQGKPELAILSIGYAEGLIDAMRLKRGIYPEV